ncbi:MAG: homoserine dehydrogenase [Clostridiales bacterium]|nr:homoserine dehydrogenase [Clostridiales bacterium]
MVNVAVLGYGVVGSGVVEVIKMNGNGIKNRVGEEIKVKRILDLRDFPESPDRELLTKNSDDVLMDDSISVVVETIGGAGVAYEFTKKALSKGKNVVTSNKELVAKHGPELLALAKENGVRYMFEASVGGGIPIIRPLEQCLAANEIEEIVGILNGTTNYILTQMRKENKDFDEALKEAQQKGYAEANPAADVEGHDACRKIAILSSIAYDEFIDSNNIETEGITKITLDDMKVAEELGMVIKLIGRSKKIGEKVYSSVSPILIDKSHPLANVEDVFNAIVVKGNAVGETMFYGRGAGKLPTASAVVADVIDIVKHVGSGIESRLWKVKDATNVGNSEDLEDFYLIRLKVKNQEDAKVIVREFFNSIRWVNSTSVSSNDELDFVTEKYTGKELKQRLSKLESAAPIRNVINTLRILE